MSLGLRIEELRNSLHLSREQLAERTGIDARQIANYELYGAWPEPEKLIALIGGFGIEIHDLFDFTENRKCLRLSFEQRLAERRQRAGRGLRHKMERSTYQI
jgi:transcriptional regulator with XRE-family HTH domain